MLAPFALDRGPDVTAGLGEALGDQPQRLTRDLDPGRDYLFRVHLAHRGVRREQHPRPQIAVAGSRPVGEAPDPVSA